MIDINRVYQKVLAIANKEQRGYITPQEFNLFADKAQMEIYNNYFHGIKMADRKPSNQMLYADEVEMLEEKLQPFLVDTTINVTNTFTNTTATPSPSSALDISTLNIHKLVRVTRGNGTVVTPINKSQIHNTEGNPLTKATLTRSVFVRQDMNGGTFLNVIPAVTASTSTVDTSTPADGVLDAEPFVVSFYKRPEPPNWPFVVVTGKALYNGAANDLQDFELHTSEEEDLVSRILMLAGVMMKQQDIQQAGLQDIQLAKQQQNS
jgi:hypothetical protein